MMALVKPKSKAEFLKLERTTWQKLNAPIQKLPLSAWTEPGAAGDWSLKDVWAHLADWMSETRRVLPMLLRDKRVPINIPVFNAKHYRRNRMLTTAVARRRAERERARFLALVKSLTKEQLLDNRRVYNWVAYSSYNHYVEHIPNLVRFGRKMLQR